VWKSSNEEIKRTLNLGNACYKAVQNLASSRFLTKNLENENTVI
jgi:hypothetical protein